MRLRHRSDNEDPDLASPQPEPDNAPKARGKGMKAVGSGKTADRESSDSTSQKMYYLVFQDSPVQSLLNTKVPVDFEASSTVSVGRDPTNTIAFPDSDVSRHHAELSMVGARIMLKDLQSTNGTYTKEGNKFQQVNGSVPVKLKTIIKFGTSTIVQLVRETETFYEH